MQRTDTSALETLGCRNIIIKIQLDFLRVNTRKAVDARGYKLRRHRR